MKKITVLIIAIIMTLVLCACDSQEVKDAKAAYEEGDYAKTVELLSKEKDLDQDAKDILIFSEANVLNKDGKNLDAVKKLVTCSQGTQAEQFEEMYTAALDDAIATKAPDSVIELLKIDETKTDAVYDTITKACKDKDYNGFVVLEGLVENLDDGDLKTKLSEFAKEYTILKAQSFMLGTWERHVEGVEKNARVKIVSYNDNYVGRVVRVGDDQKDYHFKEDDILMQDFEFENGDKFIYSGLVKYTDGSSEREIATGTIDYKKDTYSVQLSGNVVRSEYTYTRVE